MCLALFAASDNVLVETGTLMGQGRQVSREDWTELELRHLQHLHLEHVVDACLGLTGGVAIFGVEMSNDDLLVILEESGLEEVLGSR